MNPASVSTIVPWPEPTANSVPDAQDPPSCIPIPNRNAPSSSATPSGPADGAGVVPNSPVPVPMTSANRVAVAPSSTACARSPAPCPTATSCRHAELNPNREWNNAIPSPIPSPSKTACCRPNRTPTYATRAAPKSTNAPSSRRWTGATDVSESITIEHPHTSPTNGTPVGT